MKAKAKMNMLMKLLSFKPDWLDHLKRSAVLDGDAVFLHQQSQDMLSGVHATVSHLCYVVNAVTSRLNGSSCKRLSVRACCQAQYAKQEVPFESDVVRTSCWMRQSGAW